MICPYVYKITNIITGKFYIGVRYGHIKFNRLPKEDIGIYYKSSSTYVRDAIAKYGETAFVYEILYEYGNIDVCYWYEQLLIRECAKNPRCMNRKYIDPDTGKFGMCRFGRPSTDATKAKLRACNLGSMVSADTREKIRIKTTGKKRSELTKARIRESAKGRTMSEEAKQHLSKLNTGKPVSDDTRRKLSISGKGRVVSLASREKHRAAMLGKNLGIKRSDETKQRISDSTRGIAKKQIECPHCGKIGGEPAMKRHHFDNCKIKN
jgi:hypothetical protein